MDPLIAALEKEGYGVGGMGASITNVVHTQGWVHCHSAATDASGVVKSVMDELYPYFDGTQKLPADRMPQQTQEVADSIFSTYIVPFEAISLLLLAALIGAIVVARRD